MALAIDGQGVHAIVKSGSKLSYALYNLSSGRAEQDCPFPSDTSSFLGLEPNNIQLTAAADSVLILRDGNSTLYPLAKDCADAIRDPHWLDLPPVRSIGTGIHILPTTQRQTPQIALIVLAFDPQLLMPKILRCDIEGLRAILDPKSPSEESAILAAVGTERCDGNRNILHACVAMCTPTSNKEDPVSVTVNTSDPSAGTGASAPPPTSAGTGLESINVITNALGARSVSPGEIILQAIETDDRTCEEHLQTLSWPPEHFDPASGDEDSLLGKGNPITASSTSVQAPCVSDPAERRANALQALKLLCEAPAISSTLRGLLLAKDAQGQTPFMLAVQVRAYPAALALLEAMERLGNWQDMVYAPGAGPDDSPLHVVCSNDTCSFTWTGAEHINQDIFECRTCGLTGSLCCCTECARVCHRGHDCKLKVSY